MIRYGAVEETGLLNQIASGMSVKKGKRESSSMWPSRAICSRRNALAVLSEKPDFTVQRANSVLYTTFGIMAEELVLGSLKKKLLFSNYKLPDNEINLSGYIDGLIMHDGRVHVLEIKTCGKLPPSPKKGHLAQTMIYSAVTGFPPIIYYLSREIADWSGELKHTLFEPSYDLQMLKDYLYQPAVSFYAVQKKAIPERPMHMKKSYCGFCNFKAGCWDGEKETVPELSPSEHLEVVNQAHQFVERYMDVGVIRDRQRGILKFIQRYSVNGSSLLSGDWENFLIKT